MTIPITIVAGYLGAGKTTLINQALDRALQNPGSSDHLAVLVNDFGSINIDEALIREQHPDSQVVGLANGCVCCTIADDFSRTLATLPELGIQHVLLEASGVALPDKLRRQCLLPGFHPSETFVLVDMQNHQSHLGDKYVGRLAASQVEQAGQLVLSKAPATPVSTLNLPDRPTWLAEDPALIEALLKPAPEALPVPQTAKEATTDLAVLVTPLTAQVTEAQIRTALSELPAYVQRVKGFARTPKGCVCVHRVGQQVTVSPSSPQEGGLVLFCPTEFRPALTRHLDHVIQELRAPSC
ncbi:MAG: GTP-binding protein [Pseudomonadota bacterium]